MSSIKRNVILNTVKTLVGILFPMITFPYISRVLSVDQIGMYNFSSSVVSYFSLLAALGVSTYAIREGTRFRENTGQIQEFVSEIFTINIFSTIFSYIVLFVCLVIFSSLRSHKDIILILSIQIVFNTFGVAWICNIYEDFYYITIRTILFQIMSIVLMFVFVKSTADLYNYVYITTFATCSSNLANYIYINKKYTRIKIHLTNKIREHIKPILIIFGTTLTMTLYVNSDITILGILTNDYSVGLYSSAVKIYSIIKNILVAIVIVLVPRFSLYFSDNNKEKIHNMFNLVMQYMILLMLPMTIGLIMLSKEILLLFVGIKYQDAYISLMILSIATLFSMFAYVFINCILVPLKKEKYVFKISLFSAIINILLNLIFIPIWGYNVAAVTTVVAELIMCMLAIFEGKKEVSVSGLKDTIFITFIGVLAIALVCMFSKLFISNLFFRMLISICISIFVYFTILLLFKHPIIVEYFNKIKVIANHRK